MKLFILGAVIGGLVGLAIPDAKEVIGQPAETSMVLPQGTCEPEKTQVIHTDGARQMTQVIGRGVNCVVVMQ